MNSVLERFFFWPCATFSHIASGSFFKPASGICEAELRKAFQKSEGLLLRVMGLRASTSAANADGSSNEETRVLMHLDQAGMAVPGWVWKVLMWRFVMWVNEGHFKMTGWWWLEHDWIIFPEILGSSSSQLTFIFFRRVETTNQKLVFTNHDWEWSVYTVYTTSKNGDDWLMVYCCLSNITPNTIMEVSYVGSSDQSSWTP